MPLASGTKLGPYEIADQLGAGGMGEVYRATDTRLDRTVAIKVLPEHLADDPQRRERFEREAKAVSSLNHPHICTLHDIGEQDGIHYLVMEYVDGETLQQRLEKGRLPFDQALEYAIEIADALDKAHRQGVVHRDLKPGNIMITRSGTKLLDFGLAKLRGDAVQVSPHSQMATQDAPASLTAEGTILGTLQYMAPEQLEGKEADVRTDIFAFGALVYEMVTGQKAFEAASQASLIAAILERDPRSMSEVQSTTPWLFDRTIRRCVAKDADDRWQTASDLMHELKWVAEEGADSRARTGNRSVVPKTRGSLALATAVLILTAASAALYFGFRADGREVLRFSLLLPERTRPALLAHPAVSPDGRKVAYVLASAGGGRAIWVRDLNSLDALQLSGTEGAEMPFWSPGSESIGFFVDDRIKRVDLAGDVAQTVCAVTPDHTAGGATWNRNGEILFGDDGPLYVVPDTGGEPQPATRVDASAGEVLHWRPHFLPDGRHFIYHIQGSNPEDDGIHIGSLDSDETTLLMRTDTNALYASPGYLLFLRERTLMAQPFDANRLEVTGPPWAIAEGVSKNTTLDFGAFSVSDNGVLAYWSGARLADTQLAWFDRAGALVERVGQPGRHVDVKLSHDRSRVAVETLDETETGDIWVIDLERGLPTRVTSSPMWDYSPIWSPDSQYILFGSNRDNTLGRVPFFIASSLGSGTEEIALLAGEAIEASHPADWSMDGSTILYTRHNPETGFDVWSLPATDGPPFDESRSTPFVATGSRDGEARFSRDGRLVAYTSEESGQPEVYVQPFPGPGAKVRVSADGGSQPLWRADGGELFYLARDENLMAVPIVVGDRFTPGEAESLFEAVYRRFEFHDISLRINCGLCVKRDPTPIAMACTARSLWFQMSFERSAKTAKSTCFQNHTQERPL